MGHALDRRDTTSRSFCLMSFLPNLSGHQLVKLFAKDGWCVVRQRGSHMILVKEGSFSTLSIPDHKEIAKGTLRSLIRASGLTVEEFLDLI